MLKLFHFLFILLSVSTFVGKILLLEKNSPLLEQKIVKIAPHAISSLLLLSGILLVIQGHWLEGAYGWLVTKMIALVGYIGLGIIAVHQTGLNRWKAFGGAMACFLFMAAVASTKNPFIFF